MKLLYTISLILFLINASLISQSKVEFTSGIDGSLVTFTDSNLPIVVINTNGQVIPNDDKITADMGIIYNGEGVRNHLTDPFNNYNGKIGIEIRGSSSQQFPKKQYAVETRDAQGNDLKVSLLGFPEESDWILFAPYNDKSLMRDVLAYKIASSMGRYASRSKFCEVVLNGDYVGVYVLLEKVKRDANRVNIKKLEATDITGDALTGGYIIKIDKTDGENNDGWYSTYLPYPQANFSIFYQYHYPKPDNIVQQQKDYIKSKIFSFETRMQMSNVSDTLNGYPFYLDVNSFVDFFLVNEIAKNVDAYRLSTYLYKDRDSRNPKIFAGPVWDFNIAFGNADYYQGWYTSGWQLQFLTDYQNIPSYEPFLTPNWWRKIFDDNYFRNKAYARWQALKNNVLGTTKIYSYIDSLVTLLDESKTRNFERWPVLGVYVWPNKYVFSTYLQEVNYLKSWISNRWNWMDMNMIGVPTGLNEEPIELMNFKLEQNYPNPFNPVTNISYSVPEPTFVTLKIYDFLGREISTLVNEYKQPGTYNSQFSIRNSQLSSGVYIYTLKAGNFVQSKKMILLK